jgi:hypothetical protein
MHHFDADVRGFNLLFEKKGRARFRSSNLPVDCNVFISLVVDVDDDYIALAREDGGAGKLAVHG